MHKKRQFVFMNFLLSCLVCSFAFYKFCARRSDKKLFSWAIMREMRRWKCDKALGKGTVSQ